ncbi:hypothetical protein D9611_000943 [Ephemerocybe angulata]|uniref:Peptidase C14 caspase domain-containing protein n=1 Tax=Ephemerocybe angulata TaxID=980116 RepID=A0A8H5BMZ4_9AGAR|nr:hypothetical protein D9611_000943 [Tulosesus angulatus]
MAARFVSSPNLHALIIGIDDYSLSATGFKPLKAAVSDADRFRDWLVNELNVSPSSIRNLRNKAATRKAIVSEFQSLATKAAIKEGDPIVIYYAGHGSEAPAPKEWHWDSPKIQMIVPWDYKHPDGANRTVQGIPDRTLGFLLTNISKNKGDNITVIFDSCHSGSGTRSDEGDSQTRGGYYSSEVPADLDEGLFSSAGGTRGARVSERFRHHGLRSHVLLAACAQHEEAREEKDSGDFTRVLLKALSGVATTEITYEDLMQRMESLTKQTPQCEGFFRSRFLFNKKVPNTKAIYDVVLKARKATISAGAIHGVEPGTKFGLWKSRADLQGPAHAEIKITQNDDVRAYETIVSYTPRPAFPGPMVAQILGNPKPKLDIYVPPEIKRLDCYKTVFSTEGGRLLPPVKVVDTKGLATIGLKYFGDDDPVIGFEMLDPKEERQKIRHVIEPTVDELQEAMAHLAAYYHHKDRKNIKAPVITGDGNKKELFSSKFTFDAFVLEGREDGAYRTTWVPSGENRNVEGSGIKITVCDETQNDYYGFRITNHTDFDVFPYLFYFDSSNFSITAIYQPEALAQTDGKHIAPLKKGSSLPIGYGTSGVVPQTLSIWDPEVDVEMGYLRLYLSTKYVDLSFIQQKEISESTRGLAPAPVPSGPSPFWDCITIPIVLERGEWKPPKHMIGIIGSKGNGKHTFLAELFKSLYGNPALKPSFENTYVKEYSITLPGSEPFSLVDLPHFQDPEKVDNHIAALQATLSYLTQEYQKGRRFTSFIWCYNISTYLSEVDSMNLKLVMDLCGKEMFKNVVVLTTNWNKGAMMGLNKSSSRGGIAGAISPLERYQKNEQQLSDNPHICKPLKDGGARFERFGVFRDPTLRDNHPATKVIKTPSELLRLLIDKDPRPLQAQEEASTTRIVTQTSAGKTLQSKIGEKLKKKASEIQSLENELKGMSKNDKDWGEVQTEKKDAEEDIVRWNKTLEEIGRVNSVFM